MSASPSLPTVLTTCMRRVALLPHEGSIKNELAVINLLLGSQSRYIGRAAVPVTAEQEENGSTTGGTRCTNQPVANKVPACGRQ